MDHGIPYCAKLLNVRKWLPVFLYIWFVTELSLIKATLQQLKPELVSRFQVSSLGLFGSIVRDDYSAQSDIDILVDFSNPVGIEFIDLANYLESRLKRKVDLVSRNAIKDQYYKLIEGDIIYV